MNAPAKKVRRDYRDANGKRLPGVTTIMGETLGWSRAALMKWAWEQGCKGVDFRITRDDAAAAGTLAHEYVEAFLRTGARPEPPMFDEELEVERKARKAFERFAVWWPTAGLEVVGLEMPLVDEKFGYGGTIDQLFRRKSDGALILGDLKTGRSVYDESIVQMGAYSMLLDLHGHRVEEALVLHFPVEGDAHVAPIPKKVLELGAGAFGSLLCIYKTRPLMKLNLDSLGGVP